MQLTRRQMLKSMGVAAAALVAAGCGEKGRMGGGRGSGGRIQLTYWNGFTGPDGTTMEGMVNRFNAANPDLAPVKMQLIPWGTYYDKLTLALAYGGAPDVFIIQAARFPEFATYDKLLNLNEFFAKNRAVLNRSNFAAAPWRTALVHGNHLALPLDVHPMGLYYNTDLFERAGIVDAAGKAKPPVTWEEFLSAAQKLTKPASAGGLNQWGFAVTNQHTNWLSIVGQFGGSILASGDKVASLTSAKCVAGTQRMHDLIYRYRIAPEPEESDAWLMFRSGKVGMVMEGIYMLSSLVEEKSLHFAGAPTPQFGPLKADWAGSHFLCQPTGLPTERAVAGQRLMRFLSDRSLTWAEGGQVPARTDIRDSAAFQALPVQSQFAKQLPYVDYDVQVPQQNMIAEFVDPAIEAVLLNLQSIPVAMGAADRQVDQLMRRT